MMYVLVPLYVIVCVFLILVVLLQQGKGADVASAFGASSSQTTFGARGATTVFEKITTWSFVAFSVLAIAISLVQSHPKGSVLSKQAAGKPAAPKPAAPAASVPVNAPSTAAAAPATAAPAPAAPAPATK
jgi:preprotein translocase subunit SecG